jgi:hypothetical protein
LFAISGQQEAMTHAALKSPTPSGEARRLLTELEAAHAALLVELAAMQSLQDQPKPRPEQWAQARWKLSRASRQRRMIVDAIYPLVLAGGTVVDVHRIRQLQEQDTTMLAASHAHVGQWTPERISVDWSGYCDASRVIRRGMTDRVRAERDLLLPVLARLAAS